MHDPNTYHLQQLREMTADINETVARSRMVIVESRRDLDDAARRPHGAPVDGDETSDRRLRGRRPDSTAE